MSTALAMNMTLRLSPRIKYEGMVYTGFFLAVMIGYCLVVRSTLDDPVKHGFRNEQGAALLGAAGATFFGGLLIMSLYIWASYYVERFTIDGAVVTIRSMLQHRQFDASEIQCLKWRSSRGGSVFFRTGKGKARLHLHSYSREDTLRIIRALRELAPADVQEDWPTFCHHVALPLRDGRASVLRIEPNAQWCVITRKRYDRWLAVALPASIVGAVILDVSLDFWPIFASPLPIIAGWLLLRYSVPVGGRSDLRLTSPPNGPFFIIMLRLLVAVSLIPLVLPAIGVRREIASAIHTAAMLAMFPTILLIVLRLDKRQKAAVEQAVQSAPQLWLDGEE